MTPGEVDRYADVEVRILAGHNPDLVILSDEDETERKRIDLTAYASSEDMHAMMREEGFLLRSDTLANRHKDCYAWRNSGECLRNAAYMREQCALACHDLKDANEQCAKWARNGECARNSKYMFATCPESCSGKQEL